MDHVVLSRRLIRRVVVGVVAALLLGMFAGAAAWRVSGGRWMTVETASMGEAAPVGTLVWTRPARVQDLRRGDIVSFRAPSGRTYTHRVVKIADGVVTTKGDNNGAVDPFRTTSKDLVGKVVSRWYDAGFVLRALPFLVILLGLLWLVTWRVRTPWRTASRLLGASLIVAGIVLFQRPLVGAEVASSATTPHGVRASVVSTGVFPVEVRADGGTSTRLRAGQLDEVRGSHLTAQHQLPLSISPHLTGWWWPAVILACGLPLLIGLRLGIRLGAV